MRFSDEYSSTKGKKNNFFIVTKICVSPRKLSVIFSSYGDMK